MKKKYNSIYIISFCILLFLIYLYQDDMVKVNMVIFLTLKRGIISQNCFWWSINDLFSDTTGSQVYLQLKDKGRFVPLHIFGEKIYLLTNLDDIQQLLDLSPYPFGPGLLKKNFFDSFMAKNVGISVNPEWKNRRILNDHVLEHNQYHSMNIIFEKYIQEIFKTMKPKNFDEFTELTRRLTSKIIFGTYEYNPIIYKIFKQADSLLSARWKVNTVNESDLDEYHQYLKYELKNPKQNTLLYLSHKYHHMISQDDMIDQIPHWIFPIAGLFSVHLPRLLCILGNHPNDLKIVISEIQNGKNVEKDNYIRKCILELFRLNNAVNSTFRGLISPFQFKNSDQIFESGTEFVFFNNPLLRELFEKPNQFIPSRWNFQMEDSYQALMFNQGPQKCPGKELVISLLTMGLVSYLQINDFKIKTSIKLNPEFIPYIINPCKIIFENEYIS